MSAKQKVYVIYGGHRNQEDHEHWATFRTLEKAETYRREMLENFQGLSLGISAVDPVDGETYSDDEETWIG